MAIYSKSLNLRLNFSVASSALAAGGAMVGWTARGSWPVSAPAPPSTCCMSTPLPPSSERPRKLSWSTATFTAYGCGYEHHYGRAAERRLRTFLQLPQPRDTSRIDRHRFHGTPERRLLQFPSLESLEQPTAPAGNPPPSLPPSSEVSAPHRHRQQPSRRLQLRRSACLFTQQNYRGSWQQHDD